MGFLLVFDSCMEQKSILLENSRKLNYCFSHDFCMEQKSSFTFIK